jgi:hemoglobin
MTPPASPTVHIAMRPAPEGLNEAMVHAVVHGFYDRIRADEMLGPIFNGAIAEDAWPRHLARMCDFWSSMLLHTQRYEGRPLSPHLSIPGLGEPQFRRWLSLFSATVQETCPPQAAALFMNRALRIAHSFRLAITAHHGGNAFEVEPISLDSLNRSGS